MVDQILLVQGWILGGLAVCSGDVDRGSVEVVNKERDDGVKCVGSGLRGQIAQFGDRCGGRPGFSVISEFLFPSVASGVDLDGGNLLGAVVADCGLASGTRGRGPTGLSA